MSFQALAAGKAVFTGWLSTGGTNSHFYITNVSDTATDVTFKLYSHTGSEYNEGTQSGTNFTFYGSYAGNPLTDTGATLEAGETIAIYTNIPGFDFGYGVVSWTSTGSKQVSLVASGIQDYISGNHHGRSAIEINGGQPF